MAGRSDRDADIDRLYQLPLVEFVAARNALAREAGPEGAAIRNLGKPALPAWAVNQLYWQRRAIYQDLIDRAADLRATHALAGRGRPADPRGASRAYEGAVARALKAALELLATTGHPVTGATRQALATTLRALPVGGPQGRLTRPMAPRGFEALAGAGGGRSVRPAPGPPATRAAHADGPAHARSRSGAAARLVRARAAEEAAAHATRDAEQAARRDEFEAARAGREAERAARRLDQARDALEAAQAALADAERAAGAATRARDAAQARAARSSDQLTTARQRERTAREAVGQLSRSR